MEYVDNFELVYFLRVKPIILNSGLDAVLHVILISEKIDKGNVTLNQIEAIINMKFKPTNKKSVLHFVMLELFLYCILSC